MYCESEHRARLPQGESLSASTFWPAAPQVGTQPGGVEKGSDAQPVLPADVQRLAAGSLRAKAMPCGPVVFRT